MRSAFSVSDRELKDTYSPAAIDIAPATSPATPAITTSFCFGHSCLLIKSGTIVEEMSISTRNVWFGCSQRYSARQTIRLFQLSLRPARFSAPAQAASATRIKPGITRKANDRPPLHRAKIILLIVLVESPARIGITASAALIFPDATSEAIEMAAECVSTKPATAAATITPVSPNHSRSAAEATRMPERVKANTKAVEMLKACPGCGSSSVFCRKARIVKMAP